MYPYQKKARYMAARFWVSAEPWPPGVRMDPNGPEKHWLYSRDNECPIRIRDGEWVVMDASGFRFPLDDRTFNAAYEAVSE